MAIFGHEFNNLNDLLIHQLKDLYDAETRLTAALPKMADAASRPELKQAFRTHLAETENQIRRLEQVFQRLNCPAEGETCPAMKGLIQEGQDIISANGDPDVKDAGLIGAAQKVEHYEIASYGTARTFAQRLGFMDIAQILQQTLDEEGNTDKKLTMLAESGINQQATH